MIDQEKRIRGRAHRIWEEEGRPEGRAEIHWNMARELIAGEENLEDSPKPVPNPAAEAEPRKAGTTNVGSELPTLADKEKQSRKASRKSGCRSVEAGLSKR
jgi:Protein of unknown function (DUF2934)